MRIILSKTFIILALVGLISGSLLSPFTVAVAIAQSIEEGESTGTETSVSGNDGDVNQPEASTPAESGDSLLGGVERGDLHDFDSGLRDRFKAEEGSGDGDDSSSEEESTNTANNADEEGQEVTGDEAKKPNSETEAANSEDSQAESDGTDDNDLADLLDQPLDSAQENVDDELARPEISQPDEVNDLQDQNSQLRDDDSLRDLDLREELNSEIDQARDELRDTEPENGEDTSLPPRGDQGSGSAPDSDSEVGSPGQAGDSVDDGEGVADDEESNDAQADEENNDDGQNDSDLTTTGEFGSENAEQNTDQQSNETGGEAVSAEGDVSAQIASGDAQVESQINSDVNQNNVSFGGALDEATQALEEDPDGEGAGGIDEDALEDIQSAIEQNSLDDDIEVGVENTNTGEVTNEADLLAGSGDNSITGGGSVDGSIETGSAQVISSIVNFVNANIIGSPLFQLVLISYNNLTGNISLTPDDINQIDSFSGSCASFLCAGVLEITNTNSAFVLNDVDISASTGGNTITAGEDANGTIETGDADIASNVINLVNTNIIGSNVMFAIFNVFGDWVGDLIFPTPDEINTFVQGTDAGFFDQYGEVTIENANTADITNDVVATAETGANGLSSTASSTVGSVQTGDATTINNVTNDVNKNIFGGSLFTAFINVLGEWTGDGYNLPEGISLAQSEDGTFILSTDIPTSSAQADDDFKLTIANTNDATVVNAVNLDANTGENSIAGGGEVDGSIKTGNAAILSNIFNFVNTNIIGGFWYFGIINIFGDWNGNASFGQPDLTVTKEAFVDDLPLRQGMTVDYRVSYSNLGNAAAHDVVITDSFDTNVFEVLNAAGADTSVFGQLSWNINQLEAGATGYIDYTLQVKSDLNGITTANNLVSITGVPQDVSEGDNSDAVSLPVSENGVGGGGPGGPLGGGDFDENDDNGNNGDGGVGGGGGQEDDSSNNEGAATSGGGGGNEVVSANLPERLSVTKEHDASGIVTDGDILNYTITVKNESLVDVHEVTAFDQLVSDISGSVVNEQTFELGTVFAGETVQITYDLQINGGIGVGDYTNTVIVSSSDAAIVSASATFTAFEEEESSTEQESAAGDELTLEQQQFSRSGAKVFPKTIKEALAAEEPEESAALTPDFSEPDQAGPAGQGLLGSLITFSRDGRLFILTGLALLALSVYLNARRWFS